MIRPFLSAWQRYWFAPQRATDLAVCRVVFFGYLLYKNYHRDTSRWSDFSEVFWFPMPLFDWLGLGLAPAATLQTLDTLWKVALALCCVGLLTRVSAVLAFVLGVYLLGVPHNFGKIHHSDAQLIFILAAMAMARSGDHLSVDAVLRRLRGKPAPPISHGEYRWPIRVAWLAWVTVYFAAGTAKLRHAGVGWVSSADMANRLLLHQNTHGPPTDWGVWVAGMPLLCTTIAVSTLIIEVGAPLALVSRAARLVFVPALGLMQLGIWLLLGVKFSGFLAAYVFWIPWGAARELPEWLTRVTRREAQPTSTAS